MKAVANLFIARSRSAIVWFTVTVGVVVCSGAYVQGRIAMMRSLPQYVIVKGLSLFYTDPKYPFETVEGMHSWQTQLAMETIYNRGPEGLDHQNRRFALFNAEAMEVLNTEIVEPQVLMFRDTQANQKVEVGSITVSVQPGRGESTTVATGQVLRTSMENNVVTNRTFDVKVFFTWTINPNLSERAMFPTQCTSVTFFKTLQTFP